MVGIPERVSVIAKTVPSNFNYFWNSKQVVCAAKKVYATKILLWSNHQTVFGQAFVSQKGVVANCDDFWKCSWWVYEKNALETWNKSSMFKHFFAANRSSSFIFFSKNNFMPPFIKMCTLRCAFIIWKMGWMCVWISPLENWMYER